MNSSDRPNYHLCYRVLGLKAGCRWEQARRHYKLLSQRCHPDRYPNDSHARSAAEKKQRAINFAMRMITDYYKRYGRMPIQDRPRLRQPDAPVENNPVGEKEEVATVPVRQGKMSGRWFMLAFVLFQMFFLWWIWSGKKDPKMMPEPSVVGMKPSATVGNEYRKRLRFGFGDPPEMVRLVQGEPTVVKGDKWHYGNSIVYFKNGRVAGWVNHRDNPLKADSERYFSGEKFIRIGSTRSEVARIQGEPLFRGESRWDYGPSYIEFQGDKVSGWHSSPLRPLRVKKSWE